MKRWDCKESGPLTKPKFSDRSVWLHVAVRVDGNCWSGLVDGMIEEVVPDLFMDECAVRIFASGASGDNRGVGTFRVLVDVKIGDKTT